MRKIFTLSIISFFSITMFGQKAMVLDAFAKYNVDTAILYLNARKNASRYLFDIQNTVVTDENQQTKIGKHDPALPEEERWQLLSVNGKNPTNKQTELFRKSFDPHAPVTRPDESSYKVIKDDGKELVISYAVDQSQLTDENRFMTGFVTTLYIDCKNGRLLKSEMISPGPFKIKVFNADQMNSNISYLYMEAEKLYVPQKEEVLIDLKILGRTAETITTNVYTNYRNPTP